MYSFASRFWLICRRTVSPYFFHQTWIVKLAWRGLLLDFERSEEEFILNRVGMLHTCSITVLRRVYSYVTPVHKYEFSTHLLEEFTEYESRFDDHIEWVSIEQNVLNN